MSVEELLDLLLFRAWLSPLNSFWAPGSGPPPRRPRLSFTSACRCLSQPKKVEDRWGDVREMDDIFAWCSLILFVDIIRQAIALAIVKTLCQADQDFCSPLFRLQESVGIPLSHSPELWSRNLWAWNLDYSPNGHNKTASVVA